MRGKESFRTKGTELPDPKGMNNQNNPSVFE